MQKTVLNEEHRRRGARMVDFGGWEMPLHYGSQIEEHHAVRRHAGMFDVSHMCAVDVRGSDARAFLRRLLANNVDRLQLPGKALYSTMLNEAGGVIDDLIVYHLDENDFRVVINAATAANDLRWMTARRDEWSLAVTISARREGEGALAMIAVQGPQARQKVGQVLPECQPACAGLKPFFAASVGEHLIARTGYTGEDGYEITLPAAQAVSLWNRLADEVARRSEVDGPGEAGIERRHALVHVLAIEIHPGLEAQRVAGTQPAGSDAGGIKLVPQTLGFAGRQHDLVAVLAGVAGAGDEIPVHFGAEEGLQIGNRSLGLG